MPKQGGPKTSKKGGKGPGKPKSGKKNPKTGAELPIVREHSITLAEMDQEKELKSLFAEIDEDHSGELERDEVKIMVERMGFPPLSDREIDAIFEQFDDDESGSVNFEEFKRWWHVAQRQSGPKMTPERRKRAKGYALSAIRLMVRIHRTFSEMSKGSGLLKTCNDLERIIQACGVNPAVARRRLQGCMDELNIQEGTHIDFWKFVSCFSMVCVRDDA